MISRIFGAIGSFVCIFKKKNHMFIENVMISHHMVYEYNCNGRGAPRTQMTCQSHYRITVGHASDAEYFLLYFQKEKEFQFLFGTRMA